MKKVSFTRLKVGLYIIYNCVLQNEKIQFTALSNLSQLLMLLLSKALNLWGGNFEKVIHISSKRKNWAKRLFHQSNSFYQQNKKEFAPIVVLIFLVGVTRVQMSLIVFMCIKFAITKTSLSVTNRIALDYQSVFSRYTGENIFDTFGSLTV